MTRRSNSAWAGKAALIASILSVAACATGVDSSAREPASGNPLRAVLLEAGAITEPALLDLREEGFNGVVLVLDGAGAEGESAATQQLAAQRIIANGLALYYWIEIARNRELADKHPEWMGSVQGHPEWRRVFPGAPEPREGEVVKTYPWVPILYEGAFEAQLERVADLLRDKPSATGIFLNDLQGVPSSCGCGNTLCRWTTDYGPIRTATRLDDRAAARFLDAVSKVAPNSDVVPVWVTECEEHDGTQDGACAGVGCYRGACWKEYAKQLLPVIEERNQLGVLLPYKELERDLPAYDKRAGWITWALGSFRKLPPDRDANLPSDLSLVAVLQGWDVTTAEIDAQIERAKEAGSESYIVARSRIDQSWTPRLYSLDTSAKRPAGG